jgi:glycosyltransferase involved in cell wall biosynthesis
MVFSVFSHVQHGKDGTDYFAYAPYVNEMNIWLKHVSEVRIIAPLTTRKIQTIDCKYQHSDLHFVPVTSFSFTNFTNGVHAFFAIPKILLRIFIEMQKADHIHLRCPGNVGLLAGIVQILFPKKTKTIKYAGNWDPKAKQPWSYRLQKRILSSTFLTKNAKVLVYGEWQKQSENIVPFFTATYSESEKKDTSLELKIPIRFLFVGTLTVGKNIDYAIELVEKLNHLGISCLLDIYGTGLEESRLSNKLATSDWNGNIQLKGNLDKEKMKLQYQTSHFLILASKSEGWPKVVAEAMFWGCLPLATNISCIAAMLGNGSRGIVLKEDLEEDALNIRSLIYNADLYHKKRHNAIAWSRNYTTESFENGIANFLKY